MLTVPLARAAALVLLAAGCAAPPPSACCRFFEESGPFGLRCGTQARCVRLETTSQEFILHDDAGCSCPERCLCWRGNWGVLDLEGLDGLSGESGPDGGAGTPTAAGRPARAR